LLVLFVKRAQVVPEQVTASLATGDLVVGWFVGLVFVKRDKMMTLQLTNTVGYSIPNLNLHKNTSNREFLYMMLLDKAFTVH
jgi:hypothetical protein